MKGLLLKDWFVIWKQCRLMLLIPVVFALVAGGMTDGGGDFFRFFAVILLAMFPITVMGLDERNKWEIYAATMPYSRQDMVLSKYVLAMIGVAVGCVLTVLSTVFLSPEAVNWRELTLSTIVTFTIGCLYLAVIMPIIFKFGVEKGRLWYIILTVLIGGLTGTVNFMAQDQNTVILSFLNFLNSSLFLLPIIGVVVLILSALLSISIYSKKEFS